MDALSKRIKTGLYFGSFNPIHIGHLAIANFMLQYSEMDELWFIISPQNPYKKQSSLLPEHHRYQMVQIAVEEYPKMRASNVEFKLPRPSYTYLTVAHLREKYPNRDYTLIMGMDNLQHFHKWKNAHILLDSCQIAVYPRPGHEIAELLGHPKVKLVPAPIMEISSSMLRKSIAEGRKLKAFYPPEVFKYIEEMHFYETSMK